MTSITVPVVMTVIGQYCNVRAAMRYDEHDPYAVQVDFGVCEGGERVVWHFARDLLHTAVVDGQHAGIADVQVYGLDAETVAIALRSHEGYQVLTATRVDLSRFLRASYAVVKRGEEHEHLRVDEGLAVLLSGGAL